MNEPARTERRARSSGPAALDGKRGELARSRVMARAWADALPELRRTDLAGLFARTALAAFAVKAAPGLALRASEEFARGHLDATAHELATSIGREVSALPVIEALSSARGQRATVLPCW